MEIRLDPRRIPQRIRIEILADLQRKRAELDWDEALLLQAIATDPLPYPGDPIANEKDYVREEVAAVMHLAPVTAGARLFTAEQLVARFPRVFELMENGVLPGHYAAKLVDLTNELSPAHCAKVEKRILTRAPGQTISQFAACVKRAVLAVDPRTAEEKHARSRQDRRVDFGPPADDGMAELYACLPADLMAGLRARVEAVAHSWKKLDDGRTLDQRRADALCALGSDLVPVKAQVNVTVSLSTLLNLDDQPGDLNGDPVAAVIARAVAFDPTGRWRRLLVDDGGRLVDVTSDSYEPPAPLRRFIQLRDKTCQFLGCMRPAVRCEEDHTLEWLAGGPTSAANLVCLCLRHHHLKHDTTWTYLRADDGTITWTSPNGHTYRRPPPEPPPH